MFSNLEKSNYINKAITKIIKEDGTKITQQEEILQETAIFYETLYKSSSHELEHGEFNDFVKNIDIPTLSNSESMSIEGKINREEASIVLKKYDK